MIRKRRAPINSMLKAIGATDNMIEEAEKSKIRYFREGRDVYFYIVESSVGVHAFHGVSIWHNAGDFVCSCERFVIERKICSHVVSALIDLSKKFGQDWLKEIIRKLYCTSFSEGVASKLF